jgi:WhiB family redox-sensing transcriptional regulator
VINEFVAGNDEPWTTYAACSGVDDPELFFPMVYGQASVLQIAQAKEVCRRCIARDECLAYALRVGEPDGIWGGATPEERRYLRRPQKQERKEQRKRVAHAA